jgi:hypothetical protein
MRCAYLQQRWLRCIVDSPESSVDLTRDLAALHPLFAACGEMPWQNPQVLSGRLTGVDGASALVYFWPEDDPRLVLAFRQREQGVWQSLFPRSPLLVDPAVVDPRVLAETLALIKADTGARVLYFPLAYPETAAARLLACVPGIMRWERSSSPVIAWHDFGAGMDARFHQRYGSQAERKEKKWRDHLQVTTLQPREAVRALAQIEATSWKAEQRADLGSSGQLVYYQYLLQEGMVELAAALYHGEPIAYRLDCLFRDTVYALEWSFNHHYARLAPGMFLLVKGLAQRWGTSPLACIDLFGSPDILKSLVETHRRPRVDLAWPAGSITQRLCAAQREHDAHLARCITQGIGVRRGYS